MRDKVKHIFDDKGNHAIEVNGKRGEFTGYNGISYWPDSDHPEYAGFSAYWEGKEYVLHVRRVGENDVSVDRV